MNILKYDLLANTDSTLFTFESYGTSGKIVKGIAYTVTKNERLYNLGFGDLIFDQIQNRYIIDDLVVSDNGDRNTVLATVSKSVYNFSEIYQERNIFIKGSTKARTRLYRRAISLNLEEFSETFLIFGALEDENGHVFDVPFDPNGDFYGFIIKRK